MVVDFCAGAGGKTLLLGALMRSQGRLYAFDTHDRRLANLKPRLARSGLSNVHPQLIAHERDTKVKRLAGKIDRVLVDAPCTGFGTLRRNPDLKWRQPESALAELAAKQRAILAAAATLVKPGGRLVYATCSVLPDENEAVVDAFLAAHPAFARGDAAAELARAGIALDTGPALQLFPHRHGCDGFYAAVLDAHRVSACRCAAPRRRAPRNPVDFRACSTPIDFARIEAALASPAGWVELAIVAALLRGRLDARSPRAPASPRRSAEVVRVGLGSVNRLLLPLVALVLLLVALAVFRRWHPPFFLADRDPADGRAGADPAPRLRAARDLRHAGVAAVRRSA